MYVDPTDAPEECKKWFGFNAKTSKETREISLFAKKQGHVKFAGDLADPDALTNFIVETLTKWSR